MPFPTIRVVWSAPTSLVMSATSTASSHPADLAAHSVPDGACRRAGFGARCGRRRFGMASPRSCSQELARTISASHDSSLASALESLVAGHVGSGPASLCSGRGDRCCPAPDGERSLPRPGLTTRGSDTERSLSTIASGKSLRSEASRRTFRGQSPRHPRRSCLRFAGPGPRRKPLAPRAR